MKWSGWCGMERELESVKRSQAWMVRSEMHPHSLWLFPQSPHYFPVVFCGWHSPRVCPTYTLCSITTFSTLGLDHPMWLTTHKAHPSTWFQMTFATAPFYFCCIAFYLACACVNVFICESMYVSAVTYASYCMWWSEDTLWYQTLPSMVFDTGLSPLFLNMYLFYSCVWLLYFHVCMSTMYVPSAHGDLRVYK